MYNRPTQGMRSRGNYRPARRNNDRRPLVYFGLVVAAIIVLIIIVVRPKHHDFNGLTGQVIAVTSGNTIQLDNGLHVQLLGISPGQASQQFLNDSVKGRTVMLTADSKDPDPTYRDVTVDVVKAYVRIIKPTVRYASLNGYLLRQVDGVSFSSAFCIDSAQTYRQAVKDHAAAVKARKEAAARAAQQRVLLSEVELGRRMSQASFLIGVADDMGNQAIGTGFFINDSGLALTSWHVLRDATQFIAYLSDSDGNISQNNYRNLGHIRYHDEDLDYAVFQVQLNPGETVPYLSLADQRPQRGEAVALVGNPQGLTMTYSPGGHVSALRNGFIQLDISATHGDSGGPVCNYYGEVIGILSRGISEGNLVFATDIMSAGISSNLY